LTFNAFQENTYVVYDETLEAVIIDPGCQDALECAQLDQAILNMGLKPVRLLNTHCHVDHIPGNPHVAAKYGIGLEIHEAELPVLKSAVEYGDYFGISVGLQPPVSRYIVAGETISFGHSTLQVLFTPGHSPGSISFYNATDGYIISGDVLFYRSIGRYDLPGASAEVLYSTLQKVMMHLPDTTRVYAGHGTDTTIASEKKHNPYMQAGARLD
jgi:hydroxyacylglutathione hydrolase